jgi:hypothetical protein
MANPSIPKPFTLSINVGDLIQYKGPTYTITAVGAGVDNGLGEIRYQITLNNLANTVLTVDAKSMILSHTQGQNTGVQIWVHSYNS